jgi:predicted aspartyl protease
MPYCRLAAVAGLALLMGATGAWAEGACRLELATSVPMTLAGGRLLVPASVNGGKVTLIVDTGAEMVTLTRDVVRRDSDSKPIGSLLPGDDEERFGTASGVGNSRAAVGRNDVGRFTVGRLHGATSVLVADEDFSSHGHQADGLLGVSSLGDYDIDVDVLGGTLRYYRVAGDCDGAQVALSQPLYAVKLLRTGHGILPVIPVVIGGQTLNALLDTGAPGSVISAGAAARIGDALGPLVEKGVKVAGIDGIAHPVPVHLLQRIDIGPIAFEKVPVVVERSVTHDADVILGLNFFRRVHLWISHSSGMLIMQYPPAASPPLPAGD